MARVQGLEKYRPTGFLRQLCSFPDKIDTETHGRVEVLVGALGTGKTTFAALRAKRFASLMGLELVTTGIGWPEPWRCVTSWDELKRVRHAALVVDEAHLVFPGNQKVQTRELVQEGIDLVAYFRKAECEVFCPTQGWTKVATHLREVCTQVWTCHKIASGSHVALPHDPPDEGGAISSHPIPYDPRDARIPTRAPSWRPGMSAGAIDEGRVTSMLSPGESLGALLSRVSDMPLWWHEAWRRLSSHVEPVAVPVLSMQSLRVSA